METTTETAKPQLCECMANHWCRDWSETAGGLPRSEHAPGCSQYKLETFWRVVVKGTKAPACIVETEAEARDTCEDNPADYEITTVQMTRDQFDNLKEFEGF